MSSPQQSTKMSSKASSSKMSAVSIDALKKKLEFEAAAEKARLLIAAEEAKLEAMKKQAEIDLLDKKLSVSLAELEDQHERRTRSRSRASSESATKRTLEWIAQQNDTQSCTIAAQNERFPSNPADHVAATENDVSLPRATQNACCSTSALKNPSDNQAILKLADAVHDLALGCVRNRSQAEATDKLMSRMSTPKDLPYFKGDPMEWINFKNSYYESTNVCQFSNVENLCRLRKCLTGEAKECVSALLMSDVDAENIIKTLELRFGSPEIIIQKIVSQLRKLPSLSLSYHNDIVSFSIKIKNSVVAAKTIKQVDYLRSPELTTVILSKLPCSLLTRWADYAYDHRNKELDITRLELLSEFLDIEAQKISNIGVTLLQSSSRKFEAPTTHFYPQRLRPQMVLAQTKEVMKCLFCRKRADHIITDCYKFKRALRRDRWNFVKKYGQCPKCLVSDHDKDICEAPACDIDNCGLPHHQLLHWPVNKGTEKTVNDNDNSNDCVANVTAMSSPLTPTDVLLRYVRVRIYGPGGDVITDALLDDGSTITMIDEELARQVGLKGHAETLRARGAWDGNVLICQTEILKFEMSGINGDSERYEIVARTVTGMSLPAQYTDPASYEHLSSIKDDLCCGRMKPKMIIGQDNYRLIAPLEIIEGDPYATLSVLGWAIHGKAIQRRPHGLTEARTMFMSHNDSQGLDELIDLVRRSYSIDALGVSAKPRQCTEDVKAVAILDETSKLVGDHWEFGLPWKDENVKMKDSYPTAFKRLQGVQKKMKMDPEFETRYKERVQHLFDNNYAHPCSVPKKKIANIIRLWYLSHFGVDNPNKKKLRLVMDCAAKSQGYCLNDYLLQGPDLLISLFGVLLRFREHKVAITGDIKDMFLRVKIRKEDQDALRFLWKDDMNSSELPTEYAMSSLIFGACCSPFVAQYVKNKNAMLYEKEMPRAVKCIVENHYMDDLIESIESEVAAIQLAKDVREIHKKGGFEIRNWTSNSQEVLKSLPEKDLGPSAVKFSLEGKTEEGERTLGLYWYPDNDVLGFDVSMKKVDQNILKCLKKPTKREMLQVIMSVFDVQGFLAPLTIKSRILMQDVWRSGIGWDEPVNEKEYTKWQNWLQCFKKVKSLRIPRWYQLNSTVTMNTEWELHMFCDASLQAYAAAGYWRIKNGENVTTAFIASKSRVAPLKPISVPRLELQGAFLASRLAVTIEKEHTVKIERRYFWTDSSTVLLWIMSDARDYQPFVANRLGEIDELTKPDEWRYVPTSINVADVATKENVDELTYEHPWFHGPEFLRLEKTQWPDNKFSRATDDADAELRRNSVNFIWNNCQMEPLPLPDANRFSSWSRLLRATACLLTAIRKWKGEKDAVIDASTMDKAEILIIRQAQRESFPNELRLLDENKPIPKRSRISKLTPYLDDNGILRVQGRIDATQDVITETKRPAILDGRSYVSKLIIMHYHVRLAHAYNETVINELRQRYWIVHLRPSVRSVASKCLICRIRKATPMAPRQGDLPAGRVAHHCRPFSHCGADLFGPMDVTVGRRHEKRYGVIFTCMTVRAVHLEVVHSLSTDSLIMALRRMAARRGWPTDMYSDNGTNLRGADAELKALQNEATTSRIRWHFNPPLSPHMGGAWERLIRSVKASLKVILKQRSPRDETLLTLMSEVEAIINSRPLTHVSVSTADDVALTPFHFLLGTSSNLPSSSTQNEDLVSRKQWRVAQRLADMFWGRWLKEVLPTMTPRSAMTGSEDQLKVGDLVLVVDPTAERGYWPRGMVEAVYPGPDGRVRVVDVRTSRGTLRRRSAMRLARLPSGPREC